MDFGGAIKELKTGKKVFRLGWNGSKGWIGVYKLESFKPILMTTADNKLIPYAATQADMLADDWLIAESATIAGLEKS